jgi:hypothetical protein
MSQLSDLSTQSYSSMGSIDLALFDDVPVTAAAPTGFTNSVRYTSGIPCDIKLLPDPTDAELREIRRLKRAAAAEYRANIRQWNNDLELEMKREAAKVPRVEESNGCTCGGGFFLCCATPEQVDTYFAKPFGKAKPIVIDLTMDSDSD